MKKKILLIISFLIILTALITSCNGYGKEVPSATNPPAANQGTEDERIKQLESQIAALMQSQTLSEAKRSEEIKALKAEIDKLKSEASAPTDAPTQAPTETPSPAPINTFTYTIDNGKAVITKISADTEIITIPSSLDGYSVYAIGSEAISSKTVKTVNISMGIEKLDWFAFEGCTSLSSVKIPASVSSIGYGAFDNTSKSLTIICSENSFAHRYAQSYGLSYTFEN